MGRTVPTYRNLLEAALNGWDGFRRALRRDDGEAFDAMMRAARRHGSASGFNPLADASEAMFMSILLEHQKELDRLRSEIDGGEGGSDDAAWFKDARGAGDAGAAGGVGHAAAGADGRARCAGGPADARAAPRDGCGRAADGRSPGSEVGDAVDGAMRAAHRPDVAVVRAADGADVAGGGHTAHRPDGAVVRTADGADIAGAVRAADGGGGGAAAAVEEAGGTARGDAGPGRNAGCMDKDGAMRGDGH